MGYRLSSHVIGCALDGYSVCLAGWTTVLALLDVDEVGIFDPLFELEFAFPLLAHLLTQLLNLPIHLTHLLLATMGRGHILPIGTLESLLKVGDLWLEFPNLGLALLSLID
jgi:hypothetical protein